MVSQKSAPGLEPGLGPPNLVFRYGGLGEVDPEHSKLAVDARGAPQDIVQAHPPNEPADFLTVADQIYCQCLQPLILIATQFAPALNHTPDQRPHSGTVQTARNNPEQG